MGAGQAYDAAELRGFSNRWCPAAGLGLASTRGQLLARLELARKATRFSDTVYRLLGAPNVATCCKSVSADWSILHRLFDSYRILREPLALFISEGVYAELGEETMTIISPLSLLLLRSSDLSRGPQGEFHEITPFVLSCSSRLALAYFHHARSISHHHQRHRQGHRLHLQGRQ